MTIRLTAQRDDIADEAPIVFTMSKTVPMVIGDVVQCFHAEVWCSQARIGQNADALRAFYTRIGAGDGPDEAGVVFGVGPVAQLPVHPERCALRLRYTPGKRILVSVEMTAYQFAGSGPPLSDSCVMHFRTDPACLDAFIGQLDRSSHATLQASLAGLDVWD